jgi:ABC-type multidrug transport system ATPase subunit
MRHVSLEVRRGECLLVLGPNRSGKSQLLRASAGLTPNVAGSVLLDGKTLAPTRREVQKRIGFMPKPPGRRRRGGEGRKRGGPSMALGVFPHTTVREDLEFFASCLRIPRHKRARLIDDVLALFDMSNEAEEISSSLSYDRRAKLFFARVILHNPDLLLLEEPLPAFEGNPGEFWGIISELKRMGKGIVLTTATPEAAGPEVDRIAVLYGGVILDSGDPEAVLSRVQEAGWPPPKKMYGGFLPVPRSRSTRPYPPPPGATRSVVSQDVPRASPHPPPPPEPIYLPSGDDERSPPPDDPGPSTPISAGDEKGPDGGDAGEEGPERGDV